MSSPINDFVKSYANSHPVRFHMPAHKGVTFHGAEPLDITEIKGADYLFEAKGIIGESEKQTAKCYDSGDTLYSTEGSSLCIKTMLGIVQKCSPKKKLHGIAARNVHKAFINACILLDIDVTWVYPTTPSTSVCACEITADDIEAAIKSCEKPDFVYVTSPDYLGNICDIKAISTVTKKYAVPLLVDNAHGAYLKFLDEDIHPLTLGAVMCCDSAHKTLPCYTGGAMLHISKTAPKDYLECARNVMSMFASTSPSYLILQSLDKCSDYLFSGKFKVDLKNCCRRTADCKKRLAKNGWSIEKSEPLKIVFSPNSNGYDGNELADKIREYNIEPEYSDSQYLVLMTSPFNSEQDFLALENAMTHIELKSKPLSRELPIIPHAVKAVGIREAAFAKSVTVNVCDALGKICGMTVTGCMPSVPIAVSGEKITSDVIKIFKTYGISMINVL